MGPLSVRFPWDLISDRFPHVIQLDHLTSCSKDTCTYSLYWLVSVVLTPAMVICKEGISTEKHASLLLRCILDCRAFFFKLEINVGGPRLLLMVPPGMVVFGFIRKQVDLAMRIKPANSTPPQTLDKYLPPAPAMFEFLS